jgi:glucose-1-phosphate thymidylyltransferase
VGWTKVEGWWKDTGKPGDIFEANRLILDDFAHEIRGVVKGELRGRVSLGVGTIVNEKSVIKGPALIGKDCLIRDSYIGPYTSIGNNCEIINSEVEDSVVMDGAKLINAGNVVDSMIGRGAVIEKNNSLPKGSKFIIGDNSWVRL